VLDTVTGTLAEGERVSIFGFGVFETVDRAARTARNPSTGGTVQVPAMSVPRFRPGQALKDAVSGRSRADRGPRTTSVADEAPAERTAKPASASASAKPDSKKAKSDGKKKVKKGSK
jgi:DNA-binding protein HU-beta